jgi:hypothetical protein
MQHTILIATFDAIFACGDGSRDLWWKAHWQEFLVIVCGTLAGMTLFWLAGLYCVRHTIRFVSRVLLRRPPVAACASASDLPCEL